MQLIVHGRNVEINDWIRDYVNKKVGKLERYLSQVTEGRIEIGLNAAHANDNRYTAQLTMFVPGAILRAEEATGDILASIDAVVDKMAEQFRRYKGRRYDYRRRTSAAANAEAEMAATLVEEEEEVDQEETRQIVRRKEFLLQPMDEEEAVSQMELLGHDFFIYYDVEDQGINVVYRRRDGQYGLLQPRVG